MIERVYANCSSTEMDCCVVTDDERIEQHVKSFGGKVCRIDDDVPSGTERIQLAYDRYFSDKEFDLVINVQGDEPLLRAEIINKLAHFHRHSTFDVTTLVKKMPNLGGDFFDPNKVKVVFSTESGRCHYFSRAPIPFVRDEKIEIRENSHWYLHIGVYSYRPKALNSFCLSSVGYYENLEKLEQLRGLDIGLSYGAIAMSDFLAGVDTPDDLKKLEGVFSDKI